ncbi:MAG: bile acid:sodium symporter family protein [Cyclobacteriaceae bacterium]
MTKIYKWALAMAALLLFIASILIITGRIALAGPFLILVFITLAIGVRGFSLTKGLTFTLLILSVVSTALYYPGYFIEINGFEMALLITPLIQMIMFGMGTSMGVKDFVALAKSPKAVIVGVLGQFTLMPLLGLALASISGFSAEISAGIILLGCAPTSVASPVMSYLAKANIVLNITIVSVTTLIAPLLIPFLMKIFAGGFIEIDVIGMMWDITKMVLIPIGAGLLFNKFLSGKAKWLDAAMPLVSMVGIALIVGIIMAVGRESLLNMGLILILIVLSHNLLGYFTGFWMARFFGLNQQDSRTIAIATGMQNAGLVSGIAKEMGKIATVGLASAVCGPLMGFTSSVLASYWNSKPLPDEEVHQLNQRKKETVQGG